MIEPRLKSAILRELNLDDFEMTEATIGPQVPGWDSLSHVRILAAVEKEYGIRFRGLEVVRLKNVGELQDLVARKKQQGP